MRLLLACLVCLAGSARGDEALIAVATNFLGTAETLVAAFEANSPHRITLASGSTGKLFAQVANGAPYDALFAADSERPAKLEQRGAGVPGSRFTYALGRLVLWRTSAEPFALTLADSLRDPSLRAVAIANPRLAPYGAAAAETIAALGLRAELDAHLVTGENVGQAFTLAATGNADAAFVALSQVQGTAAGRSGSYLVVDPALYSPIRQDALLLVHGRNNAAARAFLAFCRTDGARAIIAAQGYGPG